MIRRVRRIDRAFERIARFAGPCVRTAIACAALGLSLAARGSPIDPRMRLYDGPDGATCEYFNAGARLQWRHKLGDWRDADGKPQGDKPYAVARIEAGAPSSIVQWDITKLARQWSDGAAPIGAMLLRSVRDLPMATATFASREASHERLRPRLAVRFADASAAPVTILPVSDTALDCSTVSSLGGLPTLRTGDRQTSALEFELQSLAGRPIGQALLQLNLLHQDAETAVGVYALIPPVVEQRASARSAISDAYPRDRGIEHDANVIFATGFESPFWRSAWSYITPASRADAITRDAAHKFEPIAGAALRVAIPRGSSVGLDMGYNFLDKLGKEPEEIYFRYYLRFGDDWIPTADGGKLPGPAGTYGRAGWGGRKANAREGWSLRGAFLRASSPANPLHGRVPIGTYAYHAGAEDFFGDEWDWNLASQLLERNRWYCLEQHLRMNTPGKRDGLLRAWIDGVLAFDKSDVYLRDTPLIRIEKIWMNVYHGGMSRAAEDLHLYIDNVVIARRPIGCMAQ
jgi:hypothetical protein